jgi:hypothetical protein
MSAPIRVSDWRAIPSGALRGFVDVHLPSGMTLHGCTVFRKDDRVWIGPPAKPLLNRDGTARRDANGKTVYEATVSFADRKTQDRWSDLVVGAFRDAYPGALEMPQ